MMETKDPRAVVERMFDCFNRHDAEGMAALYADDAVIDSPDLDQPRRGPAAVQDIYAAHFRSTPDIRDEVRELVACGERVFVEFVSSGTITNLEEGAPEIMRGKRFELRIAAALTITDGKITRDVTYYDQLAFMQQVGLA